MGIDTSVGAAFYKAQYAVNEKFPLEGNVYISMSDKDKDAGIKIAKDFETAGFKILASRGTAKSLQENGINGVQIVNKISDGRPNIVDYIKNGDINLVINTTSGQKSRGDGEIIRRNAVSNGIFYVTTVEGAEECVSAIKEMKTRDIKVISMQEYYAAK